MIPADRWQIGGWVTGIARRGMHVRDSLQFQSSPVRALALAAVALHLGASLRVLYHFIDVVGEPAPFLVLVALALLAATALARVIRPAVAIVVGALALVVGLAWYLSNLDVIPAVELFVWDTLSLLSGNSLLRIAEVRVWVLAVTPAPVFVVWYFAVRRWYAPAVAVGAATLAVFVLTGDASVATTLLGVVGGTAAIGLGDLERRGDGLRAAEPVAVLVAVMIVVPSLVTVAPAGASTTLETTGEAGGGGGTVEGSLIEADERVDIQGSISLSPRVRYTVESETSAYWRAASYDRYTGDGWVRTGTAMDYDEDRLETPPGPTRTLAQTYRAESGVGTMPAAWKPVRVDADTAVQVSDHGGLQPPRGIPTGASYTVVSEVPVASPDALQSAGTDYPDRIEARYTQLPESTPDRVSERTERITANADTPYETARVVEQWLANNREYSLDVDRPRRNVADAFLFEMDRGYCTYYATTMVTMLRSQGVPARFVVGYAPGERIDENRWVVRGLDSHAWVEVYFPEYGWIRFDPTPETPRIRSEQQRISDARASDEPNVDTADTRGGEPFQQSPSQSSAPVDTSPRNDSNRTTAVGETPAGDAGDGGGKDGSGSLDVQLPDPPSREESALGLIALVGLVAGARRVGITERTYRAVWLRYQRRRTPGADVERAFQRVAYSLAREERPPRSGETVREFLDAVDASERARRVAALRERARHAGVVSADAADEAVALADEVVRDR